MLLNFKSWIMYFKLSDWFTESCLLVYEPVFEHVWKVSNVNVA